MDDLRGTPPPEGLEDYLAQADKQEKFGTPGQIATTAAEHVLKGVAGPLATAAERAIGVPAEDMQARAEVNPGTAFASEIGGLGLSAMAGIGAAPVLEHLGVAGATRLGLPVGEALAGASTATQIGSSAVRNAIEGMAFSSGDELSKLIMHDPEQSLSTAAMSVGLGGLVGGGAGAGFASAAPLWKAANASKTGQLLNSIAGRAGGIEGAVADNVLVAIDKLGVNVPLEARAALSNDPLLVSMAKSLEQTDTTGSGRAMQKALGDFKTAVADRVRQSLEPFGNRLAEVSEAEAGKKIGATLSDEINARVSPLSEDFNKIKANFGNVSVREAIPHISDTVADLGMREGWMVSPSSDAAKLIQTTLKELPGISSLKELSQYIESVGAATAKDPMNGPLRRAGGLLKDTLRQYESGAIEREFAATAPELLGTFREAQKQYHLESRLKDALNDRLHLGGSTSSYAKAVKEMAVTDSETLLRRLSGKGDADLLKLLQENFPKTAAELQKHHVDAILSKAADAAKPGQEFNVSRLVKEVDKMAPELRDFAIPKIAQEQLEAARTVMDKFAEAPHNFSNTARTVDSLLQFVPGSAVTMATMAMGHNPALALMLGGLTKTLGKDAPDALKLSLLKFLAAKGEVSGEGFKSMFDYMRHVIKGNEALTKAASTVMRESADVIPTVIMPKEAGRANLDKMVASAQVDPMGLADRNTEVAHYLPEEGMTLGTLGAKALSYLGSLRPVETKTSPLDPDVTPANSTQKAAYNRALDIAQQPLIVLQSIKNGSLTSDDVKTLVNVFPALYQRFESNLMEQIVDHMSTGKQVPYAVRLGLSVFAQKPLDSSMTGPSIMAAQPLPEAPQQGQKGGGGSPQKLNKVDQLAMTPGQASQARQSGQQS